MNNPVTPAGIEPATFRFVAQHLNRCATAAPASIGTLLNNSTIWTVQQQEYMSLFEYSVLCPHISVIPQQRFVYCNQYGNFGKEQAVGP